MYFRAHLEVSKHLLTLWTDTDKKSFTFCHTRYRGRPGRERGRVQREPRGHEISRSLLRTGTEQQFICPEIQMSLPTPKPVWSPGAVDGSVRPCSLKDSSAYFVKLCQSLVERSNRNSSNETGKSCT
jgi:hypothetical protein